METRIESFQQFHDSLASQYDFNPLVVYRGVADDSYPLVPKIGRASYDSAVEADTFRLFKMYATPFLEFSPHDDWEWLEIAQHHGLSTRLLDWTRNPLVAAFFAVESESNTDGAVFAFVADEELDQEQLSPPLEISVEGVILPNHITRRIVAQAGLFTIHPNPVVPLRGPNVDKFVIPAALKRDFKKVLATYGVHSGTMYPDLVGQAKFIEWLKRDTIAGA